MLATGPHGCQESTNPVFDAIAPTPQAIVFQVQDLKSRMQVLDKSIDENRSLVVTERDRIARKTGLG